MEFTLPTTLEDGEYLLRGEHIGIHENRKAPLPLSLYIYIFVVDEPFH